MKRIRRKSKPKRSSKTPAARPENRRAELLSLAKAFGIKNRHRMARPQLIQALESHQKKSRISKLAVLPAKSARAVPKAIRPKKNYDDLPWSYGETELVLMPIDPFLIHAYWDFSPGDWKKVRRRGKSVVLRIYDVTMIRFDGTNAHSYFDLPLALEARNWYIRLWSAEKSLCADLGWPRPDGSFETLVRSNVILTPRAGVSIFEEARWIEVRWGRQKAPRLIRRKSTGPTPRPAFWPQLEKQTAEMTGKAAGGLSSRAIGTKTPHKTPA